MTEARGTGIPDAHRCASYEPGHRIHWHHADLAAVVAAGEPVRVHEELAALGGPFGWHNVEVVDGVAPVRTSGEQDQMHVSVTDLITGRAIAVDHKVVFPGGTTPPSRA